MSDITIQNAIHCMKAMICEEVCEECDYYGKTGTDHCEADAVRMAIKALEEQLRWIPCDEKLPGKERVLITMRDGCVTIGRQFDKNDWSTHEGKYSVYDFDVVAWMPLPEKYEG